jgi:hypothetical protein
MDKSKVLLSSLSAAAQLLAQSQTAPKPLTTEWQASYAKQAAIRKSGAEALELERERRRVGVCDDPSNGNAGFSSCDSAQLKITEASYLAYVRLIGALLRLTTPDGTNLKTKGRVNRLPFDDAEKSLAILSR